MNEQENEQEIGARFRALDNGSEPDAPLQLRRFVRERDFANTAPRRTAAGGPARPNSFGRAAIGLAAAFVLVVGGTGIWLSLRGSSNGVTPTASATSTASAAPTLSQSPTTSATPTTGTMVWKSYAWTSSDPQPPLPYFGLAVPSGGYFGYCDMGLPHSDWPYIGYPYCTSADGLHWSVSTDPTFKGIYVGSAVKANGEFVMVGGVMATGQAVVFRSADAVHWTRVPDADVEQKSLSPDSATAPSLTPMGGLAWGPNGFVAVGWHEEWQQAPHAPAALWHSADGIKWTAEPSPSEGYSFIFAANGRYFLSGTGLGFQVWYSDDGQTWKKATADTGSTNRFFREITGTGGGSVFGVADGGGGTLWDYSSSDNGQTWHQDDPQISNTACTTRDIALNGTLYSIDGGATWQTVESAGPPEGPECGTAVGDGMFGYEIGLTSGLAWFGKPNASPTASPTPALSPTPA